MRTLVPGLAAGVAMTAWSYWQRDLDAPVPLLAAALLVPLYVVVGFRAAGGRDLYEAARAGAETAALGFVMVSGAAAITGAVFRAGRAGAGRDSGRARGAGGRCRALPAHVHLNTTVSLA